ncbi:hypothetical protein NQ317_001758 [Molorchus minor]|uniref:threonine--tRNA ligase n=1 Tax=Molorchus minor TaxID=1323400 RepID=A0ABQ9JGY6_9CUCU|nr:hypothetical protein NQ317_001758 [Molorchus minor]
MIKISRSNQILIPTFRLAYSTLAKMKKNKQSGPAGDKASAKELNPPPPYIQERLNLWNKLKSQYDAELNSKPEKPIKVTLPDGKIVEAIAWKTTAYDIARGISQGLADNAVISKVNSILWDLDRPLEDDCKLELLKFDDPEAQAVFWHSTAHILGEAMERVYGGCLCYGPPIESGFYYDMYLDDKGVSQSDFPALESVMKSIVKDKQPFERLEIKKIDTPTTTVYRCGPLIDLCRGPHSSSTYWEGKADAESLQRIYGISFPDTKQLKEWQQFQEEAAKRDHRKIGREQELFFFHELSPGSCFFQPRGAHLYNTLINFIKKQYRKRGFQEVVTPNIFNAKLWQTSGHWAHYAFNIRQPYPLMERITVEVSRLWSFAQKRTVRALTGLTRVRRFQQDDAHIFCAPEQIKQEISSCLDFLQNVYSIFGFTFNLVLSTRPEKFLGDIEMWNDAEKALADSLTDFGQPWKLNPGDGAFYGPKIDITIQDALRRLHQCATIQLDFQLPIRFNLSYVSESGDKKRPVIIHRAILGSVERMIAILTESYAGKWPFWLSPRQVMVIPVGPTYDEYADNVKEKLFEAGFMSEVDTDAGDTMNKKIRNAQLAQFNFILVVGGEGT